MSATLDAAALDARRFSEAQCEALFEAILVNDDIAARAELPPRITLDFDRATLIDCFRLSRQMFKTGVSHTILLELTAKLARQRGLDPVDQLRFKYARARFKNLRFSFALFSANHGYPPMMNRVTVALGRLQDAYKTGSPRAVARQAAWVRLLLSAGPQWLLAREIDRLRPASGANFRHYVASQVAILRGMLAAPAITGAQFHATRKIVSRQVAFYDALRTIEPTAAEPFLMSRALAGINGLMGRMHDILVERRIAGMQDYHREAFALPDEIRGRLAALVERYESAGVTPESRSS